MRRFSAFILGSVVILSILIGCSPKTTPAPAPAPQPPAPAPVVQPAAPATVASPQQAAWAQVVSSAKKEGMVVTYTNEMVGDMGAAVAEAFKKATGIKLEIVAIGSSARAERIRSEARAGIMVADISDGSAAFQAVLKVDKMTQSVGDLPVFSEKGVWALDPLEVDPEGHIVAYSPSIVSAWVNTRLVKPEDEPKSWNDFLDPKWKGKKIGVAHPASSSLAYWAYAGLTQRLGFKDDFFQKMGAQDLRFIPGTARDVMASLARGETYISFPGSASMAMPMVKEGAPIKSVQTKEGVISSGGLTMSLLASAPHPNATRVFINWILGKEGQTIFHQARGLDSMRNDIPDFRPAAAQVKYDKVVGGDSKFVMFVEAAFREQVLVKMWIK